MSVLWECICVNKLAPTHLAAMFAAVKKATMKMDSNVQVCKVSLVTCVLSDECVTM